MVADTSPTPDVVLLEQLLDLGLLEPHQYRDQQAVPLLIGRFKGEKYGKKAESIKEDKAYV